MFHLQDEITREFVAKKFVGRTRPGEIPTPTKPLFGPFIPSPGRQTGLAECTQEEIEKDLFLARNFKLPQTGFRCIQARKIFLAERNVELLTRVKLTQREAQIRRQETTDRTLAAKAGDALDKALGVFKIPDIRVPAITLGIGGAVLGLGVLAVVLLVVTRS